MPCHVDQRLMLSDMTLTRAGSTCLPSSVLCLVQRREDNSTFSSLYNFVLLRGHGKNKQNKTKQKTKNKNKKQKQKTRNRKQKTENKNKNKNKTKQKTCFGDVFKNNNLVNNRYHHCFLVI